MKINFYLPGIHLKIMGGYKVIYQYANYCSEQGLDVCIYYDEYFGKNGKNISPKLSILLKKIIVKLGYPRWFKLNKNIKQLVVNEFNDFTIRNADVSIATACDTALPVFKLDKQKGKKYYFIQHFEDWMMSKEELYNTYNLGMQNIVISTWIKKIVDEHSSNKSILIRNGIDLNIFKNNSNIEQRKPFTIVMLYSEDSLKGSIYGIKAFNKILNIHNDVKIVLYGNPKRPKNLDKRIKYFHKISENKVSKILNFSSIYVCTSISEGFGLPGMEAMACGNLLLTTNCKGCLEYATDDNSIIYQPENDEILFNIIEECIKNKKKTYEIARLGKDDIVKNRDLKKSKKLFLKTIQD